MAHELEMTAGKANMFFVGETPWHGLGTELRSAPTSAEAIKAAGLDWKVELKDLYLGRDANRGAGSHELVLGKKVSHRATVRESDGAVLGVVGPTWKPLQNAEAFSFFDPFVTGGQATYETAGSLRGGTRVWILARLAGDPLVVAGNDAIERFLLISNSHDGTLAIRVGFTPVRVVCANTLSAAHSSDASSLIRITHHANAVDTLAKVADVMNVVNGKFEATVQQYRALAAKPCNDADLKKYVNLVFAAKRVEKATAAKLDSSLTVDGMLREIEREAAETESAVELPSNVFPKVLELFQTGRGTELPGVRGTLWGAYNAVSEYIVHERGKDSAKRLDSSWFGQGAIQNTRALKVGISMAAA